MSIANLEAGTVVVPTLPGGGSISFTVTATVTATSGTVTNTFSATPPVGTTDPTPATASDTDTVVAIVANDDSGSVVNGVTGGISLANVLANDTLNGNPATIGNVILTQVSTTNPGVTLNPVDGSVSVTPGTPAGNYTVSYQICDPANPTICDTATVSVPVVAIDAVNDTGAVVNGFTGGPSVANVLANDTLNGSPVLLGNVILTQVSTTNPGVTLNPANGSVNVAPGTPAGNYTVTYQICDLANPTVCDTATVTVPVNPPASGLTLVPQTQPARPTK
jgi:large repetitive protein